MYVYVNGCYKLQWHNIRKKYFIQPITQPDVLDSFLLWAWKSVADIVAKETNNMFFVYVITLFQIRWNSKLS